jgi:dienelactone hydrolase
MAETPLEITSADSGRFSGLLTLPPRSSGPDLLLLPDSFGVNRGIRTAAGLLAEEGYLVLVLGPGRWRIQNRALRRVSCGKGYNRLL